MGWLERFGEGWVEARGAIDSCRRARHGAAAPIVTRIARPRSRRTWPPRHPHRFSMSWTKRAG